MKKTLLLVCFAFLLQPGYSQEKSRTLAPRYEERMYCEDSSFVFELDVMLENSQDSSYFYYYWDHENYQSEKIGDTTHLYIEGYPFGPRFYKSTHFYGGGFIKKNATLWSNIEFAGLHDYFGGKIFSDLLKVEIIPNSKLVIHFKRRSTGVKKPRMINILFHIEGSYFTYDIAETHRAFEHYDINEIIYSSVRREIKYIRKIPLRKVNRCK